METLTGQVPRVAIALTGQTLISNCFNSHIQGPSDWSSLWAVEPSDTEHTVIYCPSSMAVGIINTTHTPNQILSLLLQYTDGGSEFLQLPCLTCLFFPVFAFLSFFPSSLSTRSCGCALVHSTWTRVVTSTGATACVYSFFLLVDILLMATAVECLWLSKKITPLK